MMLSKHDARRAINDLANQKEPFLFIIDYKCQQNIVLPLSEVDASKILFDVQGNANFDAHQSSKSNISIQTNPISFEQYKASYDAVQSEIQAGNTYLTNLTFQTPISTPHSLKDIFIHSKAKYKLWYKDEFVVFSPEIFIQIQANQISSFPMKGTIDAALENAEEQLLNNQKEIAEHVTIVDLIRNDMSISADKVNVEKFRYIDKIITNHKSLLQVSSEIKGDLKANKEMGDVIFSLLPAGSVSGAPKQKTLEIIDRVEDYKRGHYTGVFGVFDGKKLDSGVMIRFIENQGGRLVYKSGGGIHHLSDAASEYQELLDKIYVPVNAQRESKLGLIHQKKNLVNYSETHLQSGLIESICCIDGKALNLDLHQKRVNGAFAAHFENEPLQLVDVMDDIPRSGKYKCRILYDKVLISIEYLPYNLPNIKSLSVVESDELSYDYKYKNRESLEKLYNKRESADDIIILKNGMVTDSYFANIAFFDGKDWITSDAPLLHGVKREFYISQGALKVKNIRKEDIFTFQKVSLINAMIDLGEVVLDIRNIFND